MLSWNFLFAELSGVDIAVNEPSQVPLPLLPALPSLPSLHGAACYAPVLTWPFSVFARSAEGFFVLLQLDIQ